MAFPATPLPIVVELDLDGTWTDITSYVYQRDQIRITRGRSDWADQVDPSTLNLTLDNRDGRFSWRKPDGPYFGLIGRNTPIRVSVDIGESYMYSNGSTASVTGAFTVDNAAFDIVGDIDIRYEATLENWAIDGSVELCGKGTYTSNDISWLLVTNDGALGLWWSPDGTSASRVEVYSTIPLPVTSPHRIAVRAALDVDNGAGGHTVTFYTADSITGTWAPLGDPVTGAGVTSIFNSTAGVSTGSGLTGLTFPGTLGKTHKFELRNSAGTVVANPDFTIQTPGAASFADATGKTWTIQTNSYLSNRKTRFIGEVSSWPVRWDTGGFDVYVKLEAAGVMRRLGIATSPLSSTLKRAIPRYSPLAYWPMEDRGTATSSASPLPRNLPMTTAGLNWESDSTLASSAPLPVLETIGGVAPEFMGTVPRPFGAAITAWTVDWMYRQNTINPSLFTYMRVLSTGGTVAEWYIQIDTNTTRIRAKDDEGATVFTQDIATGTDLFNQWIRVHFTVAQNGGNVDWSINFTDVGGDAGGFAASFAGTAGIPSGVASPPDGYAADLDGMAIGHIAVWGDATSAATAYTGAVDAWAGETAGARMERLADEESLPFSLFGLVDEEERVGTQGQAEVVNLLRDAGEADQGILYESREVAEIAYRDLGSLYDQPVTLSLDYEGSDGLVTPIDPTDDDQYVRNDIEVTLPNGGSGYAVSEEGSLSILAPPLGVGRYHEALSLDLFEDAQAEQLAGWRLHLGTWDEARFPKLTVLLQKATHMIEDVAAMDIGHVLEITNPPAWLPPDAISLMSQGYTEVLHQFQWEFEFNCTPAGPYTTAHIGEASSAFDGPAVRADTAGCELIEGLTTTETAVDVLTTGSYQWVDSATYASDFPFDVRVGGETMTVTALTGFVVDSFTRTVANAWGAPDVGATWSFAGGTSADYAVGSGYGSMTLPTLNVSRRTFFTAAHADSDTYVDVATNALATGASLFGGPMARQTDGNNLYMARLEFTTAGAIILTLRRRSAAVETQLAAFTTGLTHVAATFYRVRFQATGSALRARVWAVGTQEPATWQVTATDTTFATAQTIGCLGIAGTGNTNVSPQTRFDNFQVVNPQTMTVTRSVNGVVKSHLTGADIRLAVTPIVAL